MEVSFIVAIFAGVTIKFIDEYEKISNIGFSGLRCRDIFGNGICRQ